MWFWPVNEMIELVSGVGGSHGIPPTLACQYLNLKITIRE
jgi:hypothetical protein